MKTDLKFWKEYTEEINKQNKTAMESLKNYALFMVKENRRRYEEYQKTDRQFFNNFKNEHKKWTDRPWYIRWLYHEPEIDWLKSPHFPSMIMLPSRIDISKPTYEGFLDWCIKKNI